jgi:uncharacterized protein (TIGR02058 family)|tara:strand:- start:858 stop:1232 length:375 start_codon:yes stop_codon:yes gene_type:complete
LQSSENANEGTAMGQNRWITEMGLGVDVHGADYNKAARRAVSDALRHSSLHFFDVTNKSVQDMKVDVVIGAAEPANIDPAVIAQEIPYGTVTVTVISGGLDVASDNGDDRITMVNAAILVSFDD